MDVPPHLTVVVSLRHHREAAARVLAADPAGQVVLGAVIIRAGADLVGEAG
jgi:hypothetical protein